jgi:hypothetical protein
VEIAAFNEEQSHGETLLSQQHLLQKSVEDSLGRQFTVWTRNPKNIDLSFCLRVLTLEPKIMM